MSTPTGYRADFFVLRTPLLPFTTLQSLSGYPHSMQGVLPDVVAACLKDPLFMEGIYIASPDLYQQLQRWQNGEISKEKDVKKLEEAVFEYLIRMSFRCTPFGLFAGCTVGYFGDKNDIRFAPEDHLRRHMRLDMDFSSVLFLHLMKDPEIYKVIRYRVNNSLYKAAGGYRYTEYRFSAANRRSHHLVSLDNMPVLEKILKAASRPMSYSAIVAIITGMGYTDEEAIDFLDQLIQSQVLIGEIEPNVTGADYVERLIAVLRAAGAAGKINSPIVEKIAALQEKVHNINSNTNITAFYRSIFEDWRTEDLNIHKSHLFQVDLYKNSEHCMLDQTIRDKVFKGIEILSRVATSKIDHPNMQIFKRAFLERYEGRMVPLTEALDSVIGIGYRKARSLADIFRTESGVEFDGSTALAFRKFKTWLSGKEEHIEITDEDLTLFEDRMAVVPDSISTTVNIIREQGAPKVVMRTVSGPSGANLLGRFAHTVPELEKGLQQLCSREESLQQDKLFAEVVHLPEGRLGNVLARPVLRKYEIPYLATSLLDDEHQVLISDLYLCIRHQRLILYSKRHRREVIPRLSSAHNFSNGLPIYNFLCDLQYEGVQAGIYWNWSFLSGEVRLPRVQYKDIILSPATWNLNKNILKEMTSLKEEGDIIAAFSAFRKKYSIPEEVIFCESDNRIWLRLSEKYPIRYLLKQARKNQRVILEENYWHFDDELAHSGQQVFTNEVIIPFVREPAKAAVAATAAAMRATPATAMMPAMRATAAPPETPRPDSLISPLHLQDKIQRVFPPGSEWLYFKLYGTLNTTDRILIQLLFPLFRKLQREGAIHKWFFLRYRDPKDHLRIRLQVTGSEQTGKILQSIYNQCNRLLQSGEISNMQLDTYIREIERYGPETMILSEDYFCLNSEMTAALMKITGDTMEGDLSFYAACLGADAILNAFGYSLEEKTGYVKKNTAVREGQNKVTKETLSAWYSDHNKSIYALFVNDWAALDRGPIPLRSLQALSKACRLASGRLSPTARSIRAIADGQPGRLDTLMSSYIHMFVNRFFADYQLEKEYRLYVFLNKFYPSLKIRMAASSNSSLPSCSPFTDTSTGTSIRTPTR